MNEKRFLRADDVAAYLDISKSAAYKVIASLNANLKAEGYLTIQGRVSKAYFEEKIYQPHIDMRR